MKWLFNIENTIAGWSSLSLKPDSGEVQNVGGLRGGLPSVTVDSDAEKNLKAIGKFLLVLCASIAFGYGTVPDIKVSFDAARIASRYGISAEAFGRLNDEAIKIYGGGKAENTIPGMKAFLLQNGTDLKSALDSGKSMKEAIDSVYGEKPNINLDKLIIIGYLGPLGINENSTTSQVIRFNRDMFQQNGVLNSAQAVTFEEIMMERKPDIFIQSAGGGWLKLK